MAPKQKHGAQKDSVQQPAQKEKIPKALREQVWLKWIGRNYDAKCTVTWCSNTITVFDYEVGHNVPESKGGTLQIDNLRPLCSRCNKSMGNQYTIDEWNKMAASAPAPAVCCTSCF